MKHLVILMIEEEQPEGLSSRKLVAETEKHNVLTAYSAEYGLKLLRRFPKVDVGLVHNAIVSSHPDILNEIRRVVPGLPIIVTNPYRYPIKSDADYVVDSHNPEQMLRLLREKIPLRFPDDEQGV